VSGDGSWLGWVSSHREGLISLLRVRSGGRDGRGGRLAHMKGPGVGCRMLQDPVKGITRNLSPT
jgi:hypothetical protein